MFNKYNGILCHHLVTCKEVYNILQFSMKMQIAKQHEHSVINSMCTDVEKDLKYFKVCFSVLIFDIKFSTEEYIIYKK